MKKTLIALLCAGVISVAAASPFQWKNVGADPCNPKAGCTLEWALGQPGWPKHVQLGLLAAVKGTSPTSVTITSGLGGSQDPAWRGWMTWGKRKPQFKPDVVAAWPNGQYHPASLWTLDAGGTRYHLIKVRRCGNWGGWTTATPTPPVAMVIPVPVPVPPTATPTPTPVPEMPLGVLPVVACV